MNDQLLRTILRRDESMFGSDVGNNQAEITDRVRGSRILIVGAAGSIGSAFVRQLAEFSPAGLHLVDVDENGLVEVVRDLRSSALSLPSDFRTLPIPLGSPEIRAFIASEAPYDIVLNFAALKHVRSERDPFSLMQMAYTNVLTLRDLLEQVAATKCSVFSVSSDKAANPGNAMGATKSLMERLLLTYSDQLHVTSTRFANVAFSNGSLLDSFHHRVEKRQPIVAPTDVRRYFISHQEAGELCLLAALVGHNRDIFLPRLDPPKDLTSFAEIAALFLQFRGLDVLQCETEDEAKDRAANGDVPNGTWPCYFFESHTTGEKLIEEFHTDRETVAWDRFLAIGVVTGDLRPDSDVLAAVERLTELRSGRAWSKEAILDALRMGVPELQHEDKGRSLDDGM